MMHLNCHTYFSLHYGIMPPKQLVEEAARHGVEALCLTDINNTSGMFDFVQACKEYGIRPRVGIEFRQENALRFIGIARNQEGFCELNRFLSEYSANGQDIPERAPAFYHAWIIYPWETAPALPLQDYELIGIRPSQLNRLYFNSLKQHPDKLVALSPVTFRNRQDFKLHKVLRAIDQNALLSKLPPEDMATPDEMMCAPQQLENLYQAFPGLIRNTRHLMEEGTFDMDTSIKNRLHYSASAYDDKLLLEKLALEGFGRRYHRQNKKARERLQRELQVIDDLQFGAFYLITWDIIRYARSQGFHHVGRGSGANSIVAYCMEITDVDPMELDLYFERFLNPERTAPPDFDIDFSWDERDRVTDYVFKRYGQDYTALLGTYNTFNYRSTVREVGKVLGLPKDEIDMIATRPFEQSKHHPLARGITKCGQLLQDFPNYLGIHAGGVLISEKPIYYYTALQHMPKGFPISHFDMHVAEDMGFHKYDVLSQRGLGHIKDAVDLIESNQGKKVDIHRVHRIKQDATVKQQLREGSHIGCFYIESPAMRGLLRKLQCDNYINLVAASSVIRPGVAQSGMMREFIHRTRNPGDFQYIHDTFRRHLGETFGVMVYQEDVIKISHHFAGLSLAEADVLRRIMSGKRAKPGALESIREKFFGNCKAKGYPEELTKEVWRQVESFSGYSFCKAHSASYAVESFQSLYLKAYYPLEFMVAVINNFGGFYSTEYYVHEAKMAGAQVHPPCVNHSLHLTHIHNHDIYLGFIHLERLETRTAEWVVEERKSSGPFSSLDDFTRRVPVGKEQLEILIMIGAFRFTGHSKQALMWEKNAVLTKKPAEPQTSTLFQHEESEPVTLPQLEDHELEQAFDEIELLGFCLRNPFDLLKTDYRGNATASTLAQYVNKTVRILGYYVCQKDTRTKHGQHMCFGTWLDVDGTFFDSTHFPDIIKAYPFKGKGIYLIQGKVVPDFGFCSIDVEKMDRLPYVQDPRYGG